MKLRSLLLPCAALLALTASAQTVTIPVFNPGFEDDTLSCGSNCAYTNITGWLVGPQTTVEKTSLSQYPKGIPGGVNFAALGNNAATGSILQTTGAVVQANTTYILRLNIGARADYLFTGYVAALVAGNVTLASDRNGISPTPGTFEKDEVIYNSGPNPPQAGQFIQILVKSLGTGQADVDNVSLTATP